MQGASFKTRNSDWNMLLLFASTFFVYALSDSISAGKPKS